MTYAGLDEETFEAANAGFDKWDEFVFVSGDHTAIETDVDPALVLRCCDFQVQILNGCCGWDRIQRHVNERCNTAECRCFCPGLKPFPLGPPTRFIQMHMCINQPWHKDVGSIVFIGRTVGECITQENLVVNLGDFTGNGVDDEGRGNESAVD